MEEHNILIPLLLTLGAGLATGNGSAIAFFAKRTNKRLLSFSLGLSGGVMIYVSFVELFQQAAAQEGIILIPQRSRDRQVSHGLFLFFREQRLQSRFAGMNRHMGLYVLGLQSAWQEHDE